MQASVPFSRSAAPGQRELWALAAITLGGLALRLVEAASQPLWADEALTLVLVEWPATDLLLRPVDPTGGLYYVLHQLLVPPDAGLTAIRGISIVAGTLSIPAVHSVARLGIGRSYGLLAAVLLAISPALVDYSQEARAYALQLFLVLLSAAGMLGWAKRLGQGGGTGALVLFSVATVLAFSTHLAAVFWVLPAVPLALWLTLRRGTAEQKRAFVMALAAMAIGALPETVRLMWRASLGGGFTWLQQSSPAEALATWSEVLLPTEGLLGTPAAHMLTVAAVLLLAWRLLVHRSELRAWASESPAGAGAVAIFVLAPLAVWLFGFLLVPIFMPRTILIGIPGFILLICLVDRLEKGGAVAIAAVLLFSLSLIASGPVRAKEDWKGVAARLATSTQAGDVIVHCAAWKYPAFRHAAGPGEAPSFFVVDGHMVLVDRAGEGWERSFFRAVTEPPMRYLIGQEARRPLREGELLPFRRAWLVESECGPNDLAATLEWLGQGRLSLAWRSKPAKHHAGIRLWLFDAGEAATRPIRSITD